MKHWKWCSNDSELSEAGRVLGQMIHNCSDHGQGRFWFGIQNIELVSIVLKFATTGPQNLGTRDCYFSDQACVSIPWTPQVQFSGKINKWIIVCDAEMGAYSCSHSHCSSGHRTPRQQISPWLPIMNVGQWTLLGEESFYNVRTS